MSIDITYIKSAIETLDLIQQLFANLRESQTTNQLNDFLSQIESKAVARISSSLGQKLGISIPVADQEGKSSQYWKGVRDMAKLAKKQFLAFKNDQKFTQFLVTTQNALSAKIEPEKQDISPLEELLSGQTPAVEEIKPTSPLEEILTETTPAPVPIPVIPTPEPKPIPEPEPTPIPTPIVPTPEPLPIPEPEPKPIPTPIVPTPEPIPIPEPEPKPIPEPEQIPIPEPEPIPELPSDSLGNVSQTYREPISPITPTAAQVTEPLPDKFQALDEALKTSGLEQSVETPTDSTPSLKDMLLDKDEEGEGDKEDDMLSLSLREALKILRDEDED
ncbi:MAG: hypothetical protein ACXACU_09770 [Candidatus Hodarchaeales archaeon]|jgi:hypothetical protein